MAPKKFLPPPSESTEGLREHIEAMKKGRLAKVCPADLAKAVKKLPDNEDEDMDDALDQHNLGDDNMEGAKFTPAHDVHGTVATDESSLDPANRTEDTTVTLINQTARQKIESVQFGDNILDPTTMTSALLPSKPEVRALTELLKAYPRTDEEKQKFFLLGYRMKSDYVIKTAEATLRAVEQLLATMTKNVRDNRHLSYSMTEQIKGMMSFAPDKMEKGSTSSAIPTEASTKRESMDVDPPDAKVQKMDLEAQMEILELIFNLAGTSHKDMFKKFELSVGHMFEAMEPIYNMMQVQDMSFMDDEQWPVIIEDYLSHKCEKTRINYELDPGHDKK
jgi:hypothetical protein